MKKRITMVSKGSKKALCYTALIVLSETQAKKLESPELVKTADNIAVDLGVEWAVEVSGNYDILSVSRTTFSPVDEEMLKDIEKVAHEFLAAVDKLECEPECPSHESTDEKETVEKQFVEKLLHDLNLPLDNDSHVCGALIVDRTTSIFCPEITGWGKISYDLLKKMCELYIKAHENNQ